jgi:hypothetical protein
MTPDLEKVCKCGRKYWLTAAEQAKRPIPDSCPTCRAASVSTEMSSAVAKLDQLKTAGDDKLLAKILPDATKLFADIKQLAGEASAPIHVRPRTFWEWLRDVDLRAQEMERKLKAGHYADQLLQQRLALIRHYIEVAKTMHQAKEIALAQYKQELEAHLEVLKLEEEIAQQQALKDERIKTQQMEEELKQARLRDKINPPPPPVPEDPWKKFIREQLDTVRARAEAKQALISALLDEVRRIYDAKFDDNQKVLQIRAVLEAHKQDFDALPPEVREFIDRVESGESDGDDNAWDDEDADESDEEDDEWDDDEYESDEDDDDHGR